MEYFRMKLNPRQRRFALEYLIDFNATQAYIRAGYSARTAGVGGAQLLKHPKIQEIIRAAQEKKENEAIMTREQILEELSILARSDMKDYVEIADDTGAIRARGFEEMPAGASRALQSINEDRAIRETPDGASVTIFDKVNFRLHDKIRALELLGRHRGLFPTKIEGALSIQGKLSIEEMRKSAEGREGGDPED